MIRRCQRPKSALPPSRDLRGSKLARFHGSWWTVETLKQKLADTKERQRRRVQNADDLKEVILGLAARDEILKRAEDLDLDEDPQVADQMENLGGEFRLRLLGGGSSRIRWGGMGGPTLCSVGSMKKTR